MKTLLRRWGEVEKSPRYWQLWALAMWAATVIVLWVEGLKTLDTVYVAVNMFLVYLCGGLVGFRKLWPTTEKLTESVTELIGAGRQLQEVQELLGMLAAMESNPVSGDLLPSLGSKVFIPQRRANERLDWVECKVAGYYVLSDPLNRDTDLHRAFVRVVEPNGYLNARLLSNIRTTKPE